MSGMKQSKVNVNIMTHLRLAVRFSRGNHNRGLKYKRIHVACRTNRFKGCMSLKKKKKKSTQSQVAYAQLNPHWGFWFPTVRALLVKKPFLPVSRKYISALSQEPEQ